MASRYFLLFLLWISVQAVAQSTSRLTVGSATARAGDAPVPLSITYRGDGNVRDVGINLSFPTQALQVVSATPRNGAIQCIANNNTGIISFRITTSFSLPTTTTTYCDLNVQARAGTSGSACIGASGFPGCGITNSFSVCTGFEGSGTCNLTPGVVSIVQGYVGSAISTPNQITVAAGTTVGIGTTCAVNSAPGYPRGFCAISLQPTSLRRGTSCDGNTDYVIRNGNTVSSNSVFVTNLFNVPQAPLSVTGLTLQNCGARAGVFSFQTAVFATSLSALPADLNTCTAPPAIGSETLPPCIRIDFSTANLNLGARVTPPVQAVVQVSGGLNGQPGNAASLSPAISARGDFVVFESDASNLVSGDTNGRRDVFRRNLRTGQTTRVSLSDAGAQQDFFHGQAQVSADGNFVVFARGSSLPSTNAADSSDPKFLFGNGQICFRDILRNQNRCISQTASGVPGNGASGRPAIDSALQRILFESQATNLAPGDDPDTNAQSDIYEYTVATGAIRRLSTFSPADAGLSGPFDPKKMPAKVQGAAASTNPRSSCNGQHRVFESARGGITQLWLQFFSTGGLGASVPLVRGLGGASANGSSRNARISDDGNLVIFESDANNLVAGDGNGTTDVFLLNRATQAISLVSSGLGGALGNGASSAPQIDCTAASVVFESLASNLVPNDNNAQRDVFVYDRAQNEIVLLSQTTGGQVGQGSSSGATVSPDGSAVGYNSNASNLPGSNGSQQGYSGVNPYATENFTGAWFNASQSGHGLLIEQLNNNLMFVTWFTYDPNGNGTQRWLVGTGNLVGNTVDVQVAEVRGAGARFIPNWNAAQVSQQSLGTMRITFTSCSTGRIDYNFNAPFGTGTYAMERLSLPLGVTCNGAPTQGAARGPISAMTGAWYDPAQNGHGLLVQNLGNDDVLATWYTYDNTGAIAWLIGQGRIVGNSVVLTVQRPSGGGWVPNFNPNLVQRPVIGTMTLTMTSCSTGRVDYAMGNLFGSGSMNLVRLTDARGTSCLP